MKRTFALLLLMPFSQNALAADVFRCEEPKGIAMWSMDSHKPNPDGFAGVSPVVIVEGDEMRVVWGDTKQSSTPDDHIWKATVIQNTPATISGIALDQGPDGSAAMLYTVDVKRRLLYMSTHKSSARLNASGASSFVSKCSK